MTVTVALPLSPTLLKAVTVMVYVVPVLLFFAGYFAAARLGLPGGGSALVGVAGFALGLLLAVRWDRRVRREKAIAFRITAIATET